MAGPAPLLRGPWASTGAGIGSRRVRRTLVVRTRAGLRRVYTAWQRWRDQRAALLAVRDLNQLDARSLRDIGLDRSELMSAVLELRHASKHDETWRVLCRRSV